MMLLKRRKSLGLGGTEVLCYAFAPPPVFGPLRKLSGEMRRAIRSFVFGNDMVCRLSLASAYGLFSDLNEVDGIGVRVNGTWLWTRVKPGVPVMRTCFMGSTVRSFSRLGCEGGGRDAITGQTLFSVFFCDGLPALTVAAISVLRCR